MPRDNLSGQNLNAASLADSDLTEANLRKSSLRHAQLQRANLTRADLSECDLEEADLRAADLTGATLRDTNLTNADVRVAGLERARTVEAVRLEGAKGVPDEVAKNQKKQPTRSRRKASKQSDLPSGNERTAKSDRAQDEQDRQFETGEESPA